VTAVSSLGVPNVVVNAVVKAAVTVVVTADVPEATTWGATCITGAAQTAPHRELSHMRASEDKLVNYKKMYIPYGRVSFPQQKNPIKYNLQMSMLHDF